MATIGAFTEGVARLLKRGAINYGDNGIVESATDVYELLMEDGAVPAVGAVTGLPARGAAHTISTGLFVRRIDFVDVGGEHSNHWRVNVGYTRYETEALYPGHTEDLIDKSWDTIESTSDVLYDAKDGQPLVNSAGDPFDSVPQKSDVAPKVQYTRLEATFPGAKFLLTGTINSAEVTVLGVLFEKHCARIKISFNNTGTAEKPYKVTYEIEGKNNIAKLGETEKNIGWDIAFLQCGYAYLEDGVKKAFMIEDKDGNEKQSPTPQCLTAGGAPLGTAEPSFRIVQIYKDNNWSTLDLISAVPALPTLPETPAEPEPEP